MAKIEALRARQAEIIGYVNDFKLLFIVSLLMLPLLLLMRWSKGGAETEGLDTKPANGRGEAHAMLSSH